MTGWMASSTSSNTLLSLRFAPVSRVASGIPWRPTITCGLVPGLPRSVAFGPTAWPPWCRDTDAVQARPVPINLVRLQLVQQRLVQAVPHARLVTVAKATPAGQAGATAHLGGQQLPRDAASEHEDDARERGPVRNARLATPGFGWRFGKQRFDDGLEIIGKQGVCHSTSASINRRALILKGVLKPSLLEGRLYHGNQAYFHGYSPI